MKIKHTKQYIRDIIGDQNTPINPLDSKTPLFEKIVGVGNAKGHIKRIANFADNATQQLIFELLQNADDANNDNEREGVFQVFFDEKYFLAINNSMPFTTSSDGGRGSLKRFLSWDEREDTNEEYTGKYGKGSKLLYNLFVDETDTNHNNEDKRTDAIFNKHNGPIIFSWSNLSSIEDLKTLDENSEFKLKEYEDNDYPLLTKLINTYYPAAPNETHKSSKGDVNVFAKKEIIELANFINNNLKPDPHFVWDRGTLIFIKLGKGQKKKLDFKYSDGIRSYLSFSKNISSVKINNTFIKKEKLQSTGILEINKKQYEIAFPLSEDLEDLSFVNFYNLLPVLKENHGFKFIINTDAFDIQENRQNIDFSNNYNKSRLGDIVSVIDNYFQNKNIDFFDKLNLYKAILFSEKEEIHKEELEGFYADLIILLKKYIPGNDCFIKDAESVKINTSGLEISLNEVGLGEYNWLNKSLHQYRDKVIKLLEIEEWDINDILAKGKNKEVKKWIGGLSKDSYNEFISTIEKSALSDSFKQIPIIKASDKEVYSIYEFISSDNKTFLTSRTIELQKVLNKLEIITSHKLFSKIADKLSERHKELQEVIDVLNANKTQLHRNDKWKVVEVFKSNFSNSAKNLSGNLKIFKNTEGNYSNMGNMISSVDGYAPYGLFKFLKIEEAENNEALQDLFLNESKIWDKVLRDWESVILENYESNLTQNYHYAKDIYNSLFKIYKKSDSSLSVDSNIRIFLTSEGNFIKRNEIFINSALSGLNENEYEELKSAFEQTNISLPPHFLISDLQKKPFNIKESSIDDFSDKFYSEILISKKQLIVFRNLIRKMSETFFNYFIIESEKEKYKVIRKENAKTQYYCTDNKVNDFLDDKDGYKLLPKELKNDFNENDGLVIANSQEFVRNLITQFSSQKEFIDIVLTQGTTIVSDYISKLRVDLNSNEKYVKGSFEVKIIRHCLNNNLTDSIKHNIFINDKELDHYEFVDEVRIDSLKFSLSELLPKYEGISRVISDVKANLELKGIYKLFTAKPKPNFNIFEEIDNTRLNIAQLSFAIAYHIYEDKNKWEYTDKGDDLNETVRINAFFERKLDYTKYFQIQDFNPKIQILATNSGLLLNEEYLPEWVNKWIGKDAEKKKDKISYLKRMGVVDDKSEIIEIRETLYKDKYVKSSLFEKCAKEEYLSHTIKWAKDKWDSIEYKSNRYNAISRLIEFCLKKHKTFDYGLFFNALKNDEIALIIRKQEKGKYYIAENEYLGKIGKSETPPFQDIMLFGKCDEGIKSVLKGLGKLELSIEKEFEEKETNDVIEWSAEFYKKWKGDKTVDYKGVYFSSSDLPFNYILKSEDGNINSLLGTWSDGDVALDKENEIIFISKASLEENDVINILEDNVGILSSSSKEQILLLYKYERNELKGKGTGQGDDEHVIKVDEDISKEDREMLSTNTSDILDILNGLDLAKLKELLKTGNSIEEILKAFKEKEIEEEKTTVGKLYGYIGEALFNAHLKDTSQYQDFEWVSQHEHAYDFELPELKVDVKTNIKSLKESNGSLPFYIHKNALDYLKKNPENKYDIARISLEDLGLADWAKRLKKSNNLNNGSLTQDLKNIINKKAKDFISNNRNFYKNLVVFSIKDDMELVHNSGQY